MVGQLGEETLMVAVVLEDGFAAVAPVHHVVDRAGIFDAHRRGMKEDYADPVSVSMPGK